MASSKPKVTLYWLEKSRAHRILWLLEEAHADYDIKTFKRSPDRLAPPELAEVHPLGKSPVISVDVPGREQPLVIAESANIVEFLAENYAPHLIPQHYVAGKDGVIGGETEAWLRYRHLMHYAEGSLMTYITLALTVRQIKPSSIEDGFLNPSFESNFAYLEDLLATSGGDFFCGKELTGADIMLLPLGIALNRFGVTKEKHPNIVAWIDRVYEQKAFKAAVQRAESVTGEKFILW